MSPSGAGVGRSGGERERTVAGSNPVKSYSNATHAINFREMHVKKLTDRLGQSVADAVAIGEVLCDLDVMRSGMFLGTPRNWYGFMSPQGDWTG